MLIGPPAPPRYLGPYRIVDEIGIGSMAAVHLACVGSRGSRRWVVVKQIHHHLVEDDSFVQMFLEEARVFTRLEHINVATVFELGAADDTYWIAMEHLHGVSTRDIARHNEALGIAMPTALACRVIVDAAAGLHAAHELRAGEGRLLGVVHRDVTPNNLYVTYEGVTKIVDFGVAKFSSRRSKSDAPSGALADKLACMSPEQVKGESIDRRTDVFALGVVLWELTTGKRLFRAESDLDTLFNVQECNPPRPSTVIGDYPVALENIVMKALSKRREERYDTAQDLARGLQPFASNGLAVYLRTMFEDRIAKYEAFLRWAEDKVNGVSPE